MCWIIVFEVDQSLAVEWMSPADGNYETFLTNPEKRILPHGSVFHAILTGGYIEAMKPDFTPGTD